MPLFEPTPESLQTAQQFGVAPESTGMTQPGNWAGRILDYLSRPVSSVMGLVHGSLTGGNPIDEALQGLTGQKYYGAYNIMTDALGADPQAPMTRWGSMALDVVNPLDPLRKVNIGLTGAGKLAKSVGMVDEGLQVADKVPWLAQTIDKGLGLPTKVWDSKVFGPTQVVDWGEATRLGLASPLNVAGRPVIPSSIGAPVMTGLQNASEWLKNTPPMVMGRQLFGGDIPSRKFPELVSLARQISSDVRLNETERKASLRKLMEQVPADQRKQITLAIEDPETFDKLMAGNDVSIDVQRPGTPEELKAYYEQNTAAITSEQVVRNLTGKQFQVEANNLTGALTDIVSSSKGYGQVNLEDIANMVFGNGVDITDMESMAQRLLHDEKYGKTLIEEYARQKGMDPNQIRLVGPTGPDFVYAEGGRQVIAPDAKKAIEAINQAKNSVKGAGVFGMDRPEDIPGGGDEGHIHLWYEYDKGIRKELPYVWPHRITNYGTALKAIQNAATVGVDMTDRDAVIAHLKSVISKNKKAGAPNFGLKEATNFYDAINTRIRGGYYGYDWRQHFESAAAYEAVDELYHFDPVKRGSNATTHLLQLEKAHQERLAQIASGDNSLLSRVPQDPLSGNTMSELEAERRAIQGIGEEGDASFNPEEFMSGNVAPETHDLITGEELDNNGGINLGISYTKATIDRARVLSQRAIVDTSNKIHDLMEIADHLHDGSSLKEELAGQIAAHQANLERYQQMTTTFLSHGAENVAPIDEVGIQEMGRVLDDLDAVRDGLTKPDLDRAIYTSELYKNMTAPPLPTFYTTVTIDGKNFQMTPQAREAMDRIKAINADSSARLNAMVGPDGQVNNPEVVNAFGDRYMKHIMEYADHSIRGNELAEAIIGKDKDQAREVIANILLNKLKDKVPAEGLIAAVREQTEKELTALFGTAQYRLGMKAGDGTFTSQMYRKFRESARAINLSKKELGYRFEEDSAIIANEMAHDASMAEYGINLRNFAAKKYGIKLDKTALIPDGYVPLSQRGWGIDNFFETDTHRWVVPKDVDQIISRGMGAAQVLTSEKGFRTLLDHLTTFRQYYSATTLMFPGTVIRNALNGPFQNALEDMMITSAEGRRAYHAASWLGADALGTAARSVAEKIGAKEALDSYAGEFSKLFPGQFVGSTAEDVKKLLASDHMISEQMRDVGDDYRRLFNGEDGLKLKREAMTWWDKTKEGMKSTVGAITKPAFLANQTAENINRGSLYLYKVREAGMQGASLENAMKYARESVMRTHYDYQDFTPFERDIMRNVMPFYTWFSRNIPRQIAKAFTDPGKFTWIARGYQGAWNGYQKELTPNEVPEFLNDALGIPYKTSVDSEGVKNFHIWSPSGWLPQGDIAQVANLFRGEWQKGLGGLFGPMLNPLLKTPLEHAFNMDLFTGKQIDQGRSKDLLGVDMDPYVAHTLKDIRLISELDRLNPSVFGAFPGGIFSAIGRNLGQWTSEKRPFREGEVPEAERWFRLATGMNLYPEDPSEVLRRQFMSQRQARTQAVSEMRYLYRKGDLSGTRELRDKVAELNQQLTDIAARRTKYLNQQRSLGQFK